MPSDLFEIDPAAIKSAAALLANRLVAVAKPRTPEQTLRIAFQGAIDEIARKLKFNLDWRDEFHLIGGRVDTIYGGLVIEYEPPCSLRQNNKTGANAHAIQQVKDYISGLQKHERHKIERYAGAVCDGNFFIFLRFKEGHWHTEPPVPVTPYSCARFLRYLFALQTELATTPENLLRDFGESSSNAHACVRALYNSLATSTVPKVGTLYRQWAQSFSEVCGYEENSPRLDVDALAKTYDVKPSSGEKKINPFKLFFAVHSYYATFIKLLAVQILYYYARQKVARIAASEPVTLEQASSLDAKGLHAYLVDLEQEGGIFGHLGIRNFLEGDFFGWYLESWDEATDSSLREVIRQLSNYSFVTLDIDPDGTRDLLKKLYQNLMPKELRHDLGEYYTPDWLAEQVLNQLHSGTPEKSPRSPDERLLDPACGSGTFLVLHIRDVRQHARDVLLPQKKVTPKQLLDKILSNVVGYDLNPLAVISARTNYLLALGDLLEEIKGDVDIPVYLADSVLTPTEGNGELSPRIKFSFKTAVGVFSLPISFKKADWIDELTNLLESSVKAKNSDDVFRTRLCSTFPLDPKEDAADIGIIEALYLQLLDLDRQQINGIWARIIKNAFAPLFQPQFDLIAGNPPWINWESLPDDYRQQTAPLWQKYNLFTHTGLRARLGSAKDDLSILMLYVAADKYLKPKGKLGFVITQTIFKTEGGGEGFRRLKLGDGDPLRIIQVDDFSSIQCFEGATNRTAVVILQKGEVTKFPMRSYNYWHKREPRTGVATEADHDEAMQLLTYVQWAARPIQKSNPTSPWITGRLRALDHIENAVGKSAYQGRAGTCGWLNGVFWVQIISTRRDGNIIISNLHDIGRNERVKNETLPIEPNFLFPLLRGRDVGRWTAKPEHYILVPQDPDQPSKAYPLEKLQAKLPLTNEFLQKFERQLRARSGFRQYFNPRLDPFYAMYNVGPYTFSPFKVVWREQASFLTAAVVEAENDLGKPVVPDHKLMLCPCDSAEEAHFVCAFLNSTLAQFIVKSYALETSVSTHVLNYVRIPKFDAKNKQHVRLAENSVACHAAAPCASETDLTKLEKAVNETAAAIWEISDVELRDIESSLADLQ
jgi:Eco57I restriction-modification methylase